MIYFGSSRADTEAYIGAAGEPVGASEISGEGWTDTYETYHYSMRWFDSKAPMSTYYPVSYTHLANVSRKKVFR